MIISTETGFKGPLPDSCRCAERAEEAKLERETTQQIAQDALESFLEVVVGSPLQVETFADLATVTPAQALVGAYVKVLDINATYQRVASNGDLDYSATGGVQFDVLPVEGKFTWQGSHFWFTHRR
ncbi:MAG: hypothetical protein U5K75_00195 [Ahrensia sp.]|nr:hypothetical protein [Ahrensia sp.]